MYDILLKNGTIIDGTGNRRFRGDVAIREEHIAAMGDLRDAEAHRVIDATGLFITPGFIDVNNHSDSYWQLFANPSLESLIYQGITTIVGGNSGSSLAPLSGPKAIRSIQKWTDVEKINLDWLSMEDFLTAVYRRRPATNFATLVGHGTLRRGAMHDETRVITPQEIRLMEGFLEGALRQGAIGFSTGLLYTHAKGAKARELATLVSRVAKYRGIYATYIRNEGSGLIGAVEEALQTARTTHARLHISHLKAVGPENWALFGEALGLIENAALSGLDVSFDVYPYTTTGSVLYTLFPEWITKDGRKMMLQKLRDPQVRASVLRDLRAQKLDYEEIFITSSSLVKMLSRRKIGDIARLQGKSPEETLLDFLVASEGRAIVSLRMLAPQNIAAAIKHPFSIIATNGAGYSLGQKKSGDLVHPRNFGTFPRVLRKFVREEKLLTWEEAIHKMTGRPAHKFGIEKRGILERGHFADVAIFDPKTFADKATLEDPYQYAVGLRHLIVNGEFALRSGRLSEKRFGKVLGRKRRFTWFW
ncbi:MAG: D-aminoacylase [Candidatus Moraniibacteriota bacterium]